MSKIFISYRREDSQYQADRLHAVLKKHVANPKRDIFIDIDNIPVGADFVEYIDAQVAQCDVLLAVIGPSWLDARNPQTKQRRLDEPNDFVRIEIASALRRGIPVAPILLDGAPFPVEQTLPDDIKPLVRRHGVEIRRATFDADAERMIAGMTLGAASQAAAAKAFRRPATAGKRNLVPVVGLAGLLALAGGVGLFAWFNSGAQTATPAGADASIAKPPGAIMSANAETPQADPQAAGAVAEAFKAARDGRPLDQREFRDRLLDGSNGPTMMAVPRGRFNMGGTVEETENMPWLAWDEGPVHPVEIDYEFGVGKFEVTWDEFELCVAAGACKQAKDDGFGKGSRPVTNVNWFDAQSYVAWLSEQTGQSYRLLTEAEWEYAARAGTNTAFAFGSKITTKQANFNWSVGKTTEVGSYDGNAFGVHDFHGNVWEWVQDCYADRYSAGQPIDGSAYEFSNCSERVYRGGSWHVQAPEIRSAQRLFYSADNRINVLGFRVARLP